MHHVNVEKFIENLHLEKGGHSPDSKFCVMEAAAYLAEEPWSDKPTCVSSSIAAFLRSWNDSLDDDTRQKLKPYALRSLNTVGTPEQEERRAWMATDWLARECAPAFLRLAGLTEHAELLEKLAALTGKREARAAQATLAATRAAAAGAAAWAAAAWAAAWEKLEPTVKALQTSAFLLLDRMIAVTAEQETANDNP